MGSPLLNLVCAARPPTCPNRLNPRFLAVFPTTQWTQLNRAAESGSVDLDRLIRQYWAPLRAFLIASFPALRPEADVWIQDFAQDKMLQAGWLARADRERGRFRSFLKASLRNFVLDRLSQTVSPDRLVPWDEACAEGSAEAPASEAFDLAWVRQVLAEALARMRADCLDPAKDQPRRAQTWDLFRLRLLDPIFQDVPPPPYADLVERFALRSPAEASNLLLSAKRIFKGHLDRVICDYAGQDRATAAEAEALRSFVAGLAERS